MASVGYASATRMEESRSRLLSDGESPVPKIVFLSSNSGSILGIGDSIDLNWTPSPSGGVVQYNVYRSLVTGGPYVLIANVPPTNYSAIPSENAYVDLGLSRNTPYFYVVTAFDGANESIHSNEATATTRA